MTKKPVRQMFDREGHLFIPPKPKFSGNFDLILDKFPTFLIYPAEQVRPNPPKKSKSVAVGTGHIFPKKFINMSEKGKPVYHKIYTALCGKGVIQIGNQTIETAGAVPGLDVCEKCQQIYKSHPDGLYAKYMTDTPIGDKPAPVINPEPKKKSSKKGGKKK